MEIRRCRIEDGNVRALSGGYAKSHFEVISGSTRAPEILILKKVQMIKPPE